MKVTVFGIGYVGLVQAAILASVGHDVMCVDIDENKINNPDDDYMLNTAIGSNYNICQLDHWFH